MSRNTGNGFTLVEMMVTVGILAILATIAAPSYQGMIASTRISEQANELLAMMHFTRSEAVKRNRPTTICKSSDGKECASIGEWHQGWIVFSDTGELGKVDGDDSVLRVHQALSGNTTLLASGGISNFITYQPNGLARQSGHLNLCYDGKELSGKDIVVTLGRGRPQVINDPAPCD